ncbi:MAG TPA: hypothetical protein VIV11_20860 [Kofleriaceae bacterium]
MMKNLVMCALVLAACGPKQPTSTVSNAGSGSDTGPVRDTRTEIEKRRDVACETLGPKVTACAVEDAKAQLAAGKVKQKDFDATTSADIQRKNTDEFIKACMKQSYSSRQVRVLEVCQTEETQCEPMLACLDNLNKQ